MNPLIDVVMVGQFEAIEVEMSLVYKLKSGYINEYINSLSSASQPVIHKAIEYCSKIGWIPELILALKYLYDNRCMTIIQHLQVSHPNSIPILLNHPIYLRQIDIKQIQENLFNGTIKPECLCSLLRYPITRRLMYTLNPSAKYLDVFNKEKEIDKVTYMRRLYWSSQIARMRLANLQLNRLLYQTLINTF